jgi:hypothetical protein
MYPDSKAPCVPSGEAENTNFTELEPNFAGMFLGWSSTKLLFFVPVGYSTWLPGPIICSDWLKFQRSSSLKLMICHDTQTTDDGRQVMAIVSDC